MAPPDNERDNEDAASIAGVNDSPGDFSEDESGEETFLDTGEEDAIRNSGRLFGPIVDIPALQEVMLHC